MDVVLAGALGVAAGAALVVALAFLPPQGWAWLHRRAEVRGGPGVAPAGPGTFRALAVLDELPTAAVVLGVGDEVVFANGAAHSIGVIHGNRLALTELRDVVRSTRRDGRVRELEVDLPDALPDAAVRRRPLAVRARVVPAGGPDVAVIVDDLTEARRVEAVRRDFVANISHELKTPVGAMSLLTEAMLDAHDDPETVRRFAGRMQHESQRLARLVQELIDLSRLQGADPLPATHPVSLRHVVREAVDRARLAAAAKDIAIAYDDHDAVVDGDEALLVTAVSNLIDNAVAYSPASTRVGVGVRSHDGTAEISVTDQGIGIAADDVDRIFERFYRVDPARSRDTGGTGLGLAIVKHIVTNHGGTVAVWSAPGEGSTFTVRLPERSRPVGDLARPARTEAR